MAAALLIRTTCSACSEAVVLDIQAERVSAKVPSNGKRGALHVPAHEVTGDLWGDDDMLEWDCPRCGYGDSFDRVDGASL